MFVYLIIIPSVTLKRGMIRVSHFFENPRLKSCRALPYDGLYIELKAENSFVVTKVLGVFHFGSYLG